MQVYAEYAFAENFCMDFVLLACAKFATKNICRYRRIALAAALGACFAIAFPLFGLNGWLAILVKLIAGAAICALAGKYNKPLGYIKFTLAFTAATFLSGGALIAIFSLAGISYEGGKGYILSSVPVGIPLFFALVITLAIKKIASSIVSKNAKCSVKCKVSVGEKSIEWGGFYDSGNRVYYRGSPVSIIPREQAEALTETERIKTFVEIHTVAGKSKIPVFKADEVTIDDGNKAVTLKGVLFGVSARKIDKIVLHSDLSEVN